MTTPTENMDAWAVAFWRSDPELWALYQRARANNYTADRLQTELRSTRWYATHGEAMRQSETLRLQDPATYKQRLDSLSAEIGAQAQQLGARLTPGQLAKMAEQAQQLGWNSTQIKNALADYVNVAKNGPFAGQFTGDAGQAQRSLQQAAYANGYKMSDQTLQNWTRRIVKGEATPEDYEAYIRRQAALMFPSFADELNAGMDMSDIASPYVESMARMLEVSPTSIDLFDPTIRNALAYKDTKTGKPAAMSIYDFEDKLRQDARWQYTDNAHNEVLGAGRQIAQMMGFAAL